MKKILFIVQSPKGISPSQRFRQELYERTLHEKNFEYTTESFIDASTREIIYQEGHTFKKIFGVFKGFLKRFAGLSDISKYDFIVVYREASPIGPPLFEWLYTKVFKKKMIFDFDDAIWVPQITNSNKLATFLKCSWKVKHICRWSYKVSVGNMFLFNYAKQYNQKVVLNPTCVDTEHGHNILKPQNTENVSIGWTGSFSTLVYLNQLVKVLQELESQYKFSFIVIADKNPLLPLKGFKFLKWNKETEIEDILKMNIGVMPLPDSLFERGKCGFKIIQYLSLGIPAAASPVGVNAQIIDQHKNGFLCTNDQEWYEALKTLLNDRILREKMGFEGREKVKKSYSIKSNADNFVSLFE